MFEVDADRSRILAGQHHDTGAGIDQKADIVSVDQSGDVEQAVGRAFELDRLDRRHRRCAARYRLRLRIVDTGRRGDGAGQNHRDSNPDKDETR